MPIELRKVFKAYGIKRDDIIEDLKKSLFQKGFVITYRYNASEDCSTKQVVFLSEDKYPNGKWINKSIKTTPIRELAGKVFIVYKHAKCRDREYSYRVLVRLTAPKAKPEEEPE